LWCFLFSYVFLSLLALWCIDPVHGLAKWTEDFEASLPFFQRHYLQLKQMMTASIAKDFSVEVAIRQELYTLHADLDKEIHKFSLISSEVSKMKRLLFLFQRDLLPGINGEILESKECRENIVLSPVSSQKKMVGWFLLACLNGGMLFYVFIFALSQDDHHQKAWGRSFAVWLLLEIALISTGMVIFMHIFLPSLIMKDVAKIRKKLLESVNSYYDGVNANDDEEVYEVEASEEIGTLLSHPKKKVSVKGKGATRENIKDSRKTRTFNAARYLFLSFRLAKTFPELKASQVVLLFSSPWPRQSYQHIIDVKYNYGTTFSALSRSASIILIFFLTNLLSVPLAIQDMVLSLVMAVTMGYTLLIHVRLYDIFPALVIIPSICVMIVIYVINQGRKLKQAKEQILLLKADKLEKRENGNGNNKLLSSEYLVAKVVPFNENEDDKDDRENDLEENADVALTITSLLPVPAVIVSSSTHHHPNDSGQQPQHFQTRRQSLSHGINLTSQLKDMISVEKRTKFPSSSSLLSSTEEKEEVTEVTESHNHILQRKVSLTLSEHSSDFDTLSGDDDDASLQESHPPAASSHHTHRSDLLSSDDDNEDKMKGDSDESDEDDDSSDVDAESEEFEEQVLSDPRSSSNHSAEEQHRSKSSSFSSDLSDHHDQHRHRPFTPPPSLGTIKAQLSSRQMFGNYNNNNNVAAEKKKEIIASTFSSGSLPHPLLQQRSQLITNNGSCLSSFEDENNEEQQNNLSLKKFTARASSSSSEDEKDDEQLAFSEDEEDDSDIHSDS
jgi:hypothetical protein